MLAKMAKCPQKKALLFHSKWLCLFSAIAMPFLRNRYVFSLQWLCLFIAIAIPFLRNRYVFSSQSLCLFFAIAMPFLRNRYAISSQSLCLFNAMAMPFLDEGIVIVTRRNSYCEWVYCHSVQTPLLFGANTTVIRPK